MKLKALRSMARWVGVAALGIMAPAIQAQSFPTKPITVVVPFGAGGAPDVVLKTLEPYLTKKLGKPVVLDYRPGAGTLVSSKYVAEALNDGHTLLLTGFSSVLAPEVNPAAGGRNHTKDMAYVAPMAVIPNFIYASAQAQIKTLPELIAHLKANPGKASYATPGIGTGPHLQMELFKQSTGTDILHVPYKGIETMFSDVVSGRNQLTLLDYPSSKGFVETGRMTIIATTLPERIKLLPNVPTLLESGIRVSVTPWIGIAAPNGTSPQVVSILHQAFMEALAQPEARERLKALYLEPMSMTPAEFQQFVLRDIERWSRFIKDANITIQ